MTAHTTSAAELLGCALDLPGDPGPPTTKGTPMQLTIFGATGAVGSHLVDQALQAGHTVTAVVRDPARLTPSPHGTPRVITADVMDPDTIRGAVAGADAVVSALGPPGRGPTSILADSTPSIISAMKNAGASRLITISGSMIDDTGDGPLLRYVGKPITRRILKNVCADMRRAEAHIHDSDLDWTIVRPPRLSDHAATGKWRSAIDRNLPHGFTIARSDLASCILGLVSDLACIHKHVFVAK
jgi:putative NADH-flavin reductase